MNMNFYVKAHGNTSVYLNMLKEHGDISIGGRNGKVCTLVANAESFDHQISASEFKRIGNKKLKALMRKYNCIQVVDCTNKKALSSDDVSSVGYLIK